MRLRVNGVETYASTGVREPVAGRPWLVFVHGSGQSSLTWNQQTRRFAYDGWNVAAPDLPGHGHSAGEPLATIEEQADWLAAFMDELDIGQAHLAGHSQGGLIVLELAARRPERVASATFIATGMAIAVNNALIKMAETDPDQAYGAMLSWGFGPFGHAHDTSVPGTSLIGAGTRVMQSNTKRALVADLSANAAYAGGPDAAAKIACPSLCILAQLDRMVPAKVGGQLADTLADCTCEVLEGAGHMLPAERPREINAIMRRFFADRFGS